MEAVAARDDVAPELVYRALVAVGDPWPVGLEVVRCHVLDLEQKRIPGAEPCVNQILDDLGLPVDDDAPAAGQVTERDPVTLPGELEADPVVHQTVALQSLADSRSDEQIRDALLDHPGPDALLHVLARTRLEHDRLDPVQAQEHREREACRARADDPDLGARQVPVVDSPVPSRTRWVTANALFAAGTPQ